MKRVYANLIGKWTDISDSVIDDRKATLFVAESIQDMFDYDYVNVRHEGTSYRIHPSMIQVVEG